MRKGGTKPAKKTSCGNKFGDASRERRQPCLLEKSRAASRSLRRKRLFSSPVSFFVRNSSIYSGFDSAVQEPPVDARGTVPLSLRERLHTPTQTGPGLD
jgi:hypothetical protein